jgi:CBS domain-containing protein
MGLQEKLRTEPVTKLDIRTPVAVAPTTTVRKAILKMRDACLGCAVVVGRDRKPVGVFTEAMLRHLLLRSPQFADGAIGEYMATTFACVKETDPVGIVVDAMDAKNIRFVVVVDELGKLTGLTGQKGLMEYVAEQFHREVVAHRIDAIQSHPFASVAPTIRIADAVRKLVDEKIACLLVEEEERLIGVFSDRDVLDKVALEFDRVKDHPVSEVMNRNPVYVYDISSAAAALTVMSVCGYRHVPVVNLQEKLVGIVSPQRVTRFLKQYYGAE